nr:MAG TPA: hypothetical protein [Caudoviricetes sp.]
MTLLPVASPFLRPMALWSLSTAPNRTARAFQPPVPSPVPKSP